MNHQNPPPLLHIQTTPQILYQTTTVVFSTRHRFLISLLLSFLLLSYKIGIEIMTDLFYTSIDKDPSTQTHFARIRNSTRPTNTDFNSEITFQFFENRPTKPQILNATPFILDSYIPRSGFLKLKELSFKLIMTQVNANASFKNDDETKIGQDLTGLFLFLHLAVRCLLAVYGFLFSRSCIHGVIFVLLVDHLLKTHNPIVATFRRGTELGLNRVYDFIGVKCLIRQGLTQLLAAYFLGKIEDPHMNHKVFVRLKFMTFLVGFPPIEGFEEGEFLVWCFFSEMLLSVVFAMCGCAFMVDSTRTWSEGFREVCNLLSINVYPAIWLKLLDIACGSVARFIFEQLFGQLSGFAIQAFVEVYFRVALMMYYFSVKSIDANRKGEPFGQIEFQDMLIF